ncbi:MAG: hypothetical protein K6G16_09160 [Lachnospiraceae bacterium]|nr:hypothetical protein [Lachnospiraceae bacterium]
MPLFRDRADLILCGALLFCVFMMVIPYLCGFALFPDEFGYWETSAKLLHYDWSEVSAMGQAYSAGYTLILFPLYALIDDPVTAYRAAIGVNFLLLFLGLLLIERILRAQFPEADRKRTALLAGAAILYPTWLFYAQMTLTEIVVLVCFLLLCRVYQRMILEKRPVLALPALLIAGYLVFLHRRTVGIALALVLCLVIDRLTGRKPKTERGPKAERKLRITVGIAIFAIIVIAGVIVHLLPAQDPRVSSHTLAGQVHKLKHLYSLQGAADFAVSVCGKLFYLAASTGCLFLWGITEVFDRARGKRGERKAPDLFCRFLFLAALFTFLVSAVFMVTDNRGDTIIYGRYNETMVPLMLCFGIMRMLETDKKELKVRSLLFAGVLVFTTAVAYAGILSKPHVTSIGGHFIVGLSYWLKDEGADALVDIPRFFLQGGVYGLIVTGLILALMLLIRKCRGASILLLLLIFPQILLGLQAGDHYIRFYNRINLGDQVIAYTILAEREMSEEAKNRPVICVDRGEHTFADTIQFYLRDVPVHVVHDLHEAEKDSFLLVYSDDVWEDEKEFCAGYGEREEYPRFRFYYNTTEMMP